MKTLYLDQSVNQSTQWFDWHLHQPYVYAVREVLENAGFPCMPICAVALPEAHHVEKSPLQK